MISAQAILRQLDLEHDSAADADAFGNTDILQSSNDADVSPPPTRSSEFDNLLSPKSGDSASDSEDEEEETESAGAKKGKPKRDKNKKGADKKKVS